MSSETGHIPHDPFPMSRSFLQPVSLFQDAHALEIESRHEIESRDRPSVVNTPSPPTTDHGHPSVAQYYHQLQQYRRDDARDVVSPFSVQSDSIAHQPTASAYAPSFIRLPVLAEQRSERSPTIGHMDDKALPEAQLEKPPSVHIRTGDGGSRAWLTVIGAWFVCFATLGMALSFGLFQAFYTRVHFPDRSPVDIAWIGAAQVSLMYMVGIVGNKAAASGCIHHLMIGGSFLYVLALFFVSISTRYYQVLLSQGIGCGFAMGLIFTPVVTTARQHMPHRPSIAAGIAVSGAAFGTLTFTIVLNYCLRNSYIGFPNSMRVAALIVAVTLGIANLTIRTAPEQELQAPPMRPIKFTSIFRDLPYMFLVVSTTLACLAIYFPVFYLQVVCELRDLQRDFAVYMFTIYAATFMFGRLSMDVFSSRLSPLKCLPVPYIASGLVTAGMLNLKQDPIVTVSIIAAVYGFSGGAVTSLVPAALAGFGDSLEEVKLRNDVVHVLVGAAGLASGPVAGALLGRDYVWWLPIAFVTAMFAFAALFVILAHFALKRQRRVEQTTSPSQLPSTYPYPSVKFPGTAAVDLTLPTTAHRNFGRLRGESLDQSQRWEMRSPSSPTKSERTARTWYTISPPTRTTELPQMPELRFQIVTAPRRDA